LADLLDLQRVELFDKLIEWSDRFDYSIDGDFLRVNEVNVNELVDVLDDEFKDLESTEFF